MSINRTMMSAALPLLVVLASPALAEGLSWQYLDARYQQPSDDSTRGVAAQVSVEARNPWVVQGGVGYVRLRESDVDLRISQTRFDLSAGRVFDIGSRASALLSAGYTHLRYEADMGTVSVDGSDHAGNAQLVLRLALTERLETEGSVGILFDDEDTSDALWNAGVRYRFTPAASVLVGANGIANEAFDSDDILYEVGFRFDLNGR